MSKAKEAKEAEKVINEFAKTASKEELTSAMKLIEKYLDKTGEEILKMAKE